MRVCVHVCVSCIYVCVCDKSGLCLYIFITMCSVKIYNQCPRKRRKTENDADPYTLTAMKTTIRNSESPTSLANRLGQRLRERRDSQLQRKTSLEPSLGFSKPPTGLRHGLKELVNHWWVVWYMHVLSLVQNTTLELRALLQASWASWEKYFSLVKFYS